MAVGRADILGNRDIENSATVYRFCLWTVSAPVALIMAIKLC